MLGFSVSGTLNTRVVAEPYFFDDLTYSAFDHAAGYSRRSGTNLDSIPILASTFPSNPASSVTNRKAPAAHTYSEYRPNVFPLGHT